MTIRDAIDQLLTGETTDQGSAPDPAAVMADNGYGEIPTELFGTALVHFSDTAPLAQADALAPVVTRVSPIPFEDADLAPLHEGELGDSAIDGSDPFALFTAAAPALTELDDFDDVADVANLDDGEELEDMDSSRSLDESSNDSDEYSGDDAEDLPTDGLSDDADESIASDADFGSGTAELDDLEELDPSVGSEDVDVYSNDDAMLDDLAPRFDPSQALSEVADEIETEGVDLFSVEFDETDEADEGTDPDDLDFSD